MPKLSDKEQALVDTLKVTSTVNMASHILIYEKGFTTMTPGACSATLFRIRKKYIASRKFTNQILSLRNQSPALKKFLTPKVPMQEE